MDNPKISIIMGIYNCDRYLKQAIESIVAQTYTNWEIIMCDDCSSDNTYNIAERYVNKYPDKFTLIHNEVNQGLNVSLNNCLKYATGEYIARMDGDDISDPKRLEKEISFLLKHREYAIVSCNMSYFDEKGIFGRSNSKTEPVKKDLPKQTPFCHAPCMVRKKAYDDVHGYSTDRCFLRVEDYHLWIKMYEKGYKGYNLSDSLYYMRDDRDAIKRRTFKFRINEAYVKMLAVKKLKLPIYYFIYSFRPILVGLLPMSLYKKVHKARLA